MKDTYIRPCPFCGHEALRTDCIGCGYVQISCAGCGANISIVIRDKKQSGAGAGAGFIQMEQEDR